MPKTQAPYVLALNRAGLYEIRWSEHNGKRFVTRTWSTGERERDPADAAAQRFWDTKHLVVAQSGAASIVACVEAYLLRAENGKGVGPTQRWSLKPIVEHLGRRTVAGVTSGDIENYRAWRKRRGIKTGTIRRELGAFVAALNWAVKQKEFALTKYDLPDVELGAPSPARVVYLARHEEQDFWNRALADTTGAGELSRVARYVALALAAAQRSQANLDLTWDKVDFRRGLIDFGKPKGPKNNCIVPIADRLRPVLERAHAESVIRGEPLNAFVCGPGSIRKAWETWLIKTPYAHIHPHDLRRTWASLAVQAGRPVYEVAKVLGDSVEMVEKVYGHLAPDHLRATMNAA
jgi:integrase